MDLAQANRAELTLLHVLDPDSEEAQVRTLAWAKTALSALAPNGSDLVPPIHTSVACGNRVEEILHAASHLQTDWIVLGVDVAFPFWPFRDSTAYKVLSAAGCPVLGFRHEPRETQRTKARKEELVVLA